jgi:protein-tyrosine phosphatase
MSAGPFTILQVCMGNICRSPMAERLTAHFAREVYGPDFEDHLYVHGAGTGDWHVGQPMDRQAASQLQSRGVDLGNFRARHLNTALIDGSDLILTATGDQAEFVTELRPDARSRTFVLGEFGRLLPSVSVEDLPDSVCERGVALVAAVDAVRGDEPPRRSDDLSDPYMRGDEVFSRVADQIEATVRPLVSRLFKG